MKLNGKHVNRRIWNSTMVTPPLLAWEPENDAEYRDEGRIFCPEKSEATLPPTYGQRRLALREKEARVLFELVVPELVGGASMRVWVKRFEAMVATPIAVCFLLTARLREKASKISWRWGLVFLRFLHKVFLQLRWAWHVCKKIFYGNQTVLEFLFYLE